MGVLLVGLNGGCELTTLLRDKGDPLVALRQNVSEQQAQLFATLCMSVGKKMKSLQLYLHMHAFIIALRILGGAVATTRYASNAVLSVEWATN